MGNRDGGSVLTFTTARSWRIALVLTCVLGIVGVLYVVILRISGPSVVAAPGWPIDDRRWLLALYGLGVSLVYFPLVAKKIVDLLTRTEVAATADSRVRARASRFGVVNCAVAIVSAFGISIVLLAPRVSSGLEKPLNIHEVIHLGSIQRIDLVADRKLSGIPLPWKKQGCLSILTRFRRRERNARPVAERPVCINRSLSSH